MSALAVETRACTKCGIEKPPADFYCYGGRYKARCKDCINAATRAYQAENRDAVNRRNTDWREANRERKRAMSRDWNRRNPERLREAGMRHRAGDAPGSDYTTFDMLKARAELYGGTCFYCGCEDAGTFDHRIPLSRGGSHWPSNIVPCCLTCNDRKFTKTEREFRALL